MEEKQTLFKITNEIEVLMTGIEKNEGELTELDEERMIDLTAALRLKTDSVVEWVKYQKALIVMARERSDEIDAFIKRKEEALDRFDSYVARCMDRIVTSKIEGELNSIVRRKPAMVAEIYDETQLPVEYFKIPDPKPLIQKAEITKELKNGKEVPGARLVESKTISITYK
jgi:hypothetical protein